VLKDLKETKGKLVPQVLVVIKDHRVIPHKVPKEHQVLKSKVPKDLRVHHHRVVKEIKV
jgi:hypothetical protein